MIASAYARVLGHPRTWMRGDAARCDPVRARCRRSFGTAAQNHANEGVHRDAHGQE